MVETVPDVHYADSEIKPLITETAEVVRVGTAQSSEALREYETKLREENKAKETDRLTALKKVREGAKNAAEDVPPMSWAVWDTRGAIGEAAAAEERVFKARLPSKEEAERLVNILARNLRDPKEFSIEPSQEKPTAQDVFEYGKRVIPSRPGRLGLEPEVPPSFFSKVWANVVDFLG